MAAKRTFPTRNSLPAATRSKVVALLDRLLADVVDLQSQCKQAHWNVKGPHFIGLHKLFDEVYEAVEEYTDLLAERLVQLGGVAHGTVRMSAAASELPEYPESISAGDEHVRALSVALAGFGTRIRAAIDQADKLGDAATSDLCTEITRGIDQWLWFVEAHGQAKR